MVDKFGNRLPSICTCGVSVATGPPKTPAMSDRAGIKTNFMFDPLFKMLAWKYRAADSGRKRMSTAIQGQGHAGALPSRLICIFAYFLSEGIICKQEGRVSIALG